MRKLLTSCVFAVGAVMVGALPAGSAVAQDKVVIAVVPKNLNNPFFDQAKLGCDKAVSEIGADKVECVFTGPPEHGGGDEQVQIVADLIAKGVDGIAVAAANAAAMGISPMIGETVPPGLKRWLGRLGYFVWAVRCLIRFRPFRLTVDDGEARHTLWATEVRIANGRFHGGVELIEDASPDDGQIVVQAVTGKNVMRLAWDWFACFCRLPARDRPAPARGAVAAGRESGGRPPDLRMGRELLAGPIAKPRAGRRSGARRARAACYPTSAARERAQRRGNGQCEPHESNGR